jgi:hypothetical protein
MVDFYGDVRQPNAGVLRDEGTCKSSAQHVRAHGQSVHTVVHVRTDGSDHVHCALTHHAIVQRDAAHLLASLADPTIV